MHQAGSSPTPTCWACWPPTAASRATSIKRSQFIAGRHPGNSGGPVTDASGQVIGVAVSGLANTQIHFAIPPETVFNFLNGRSTSHMVTEHRYKDGDAVKMRVRVEL